MAGLTVYPSLCIHCILLYTYDKDVSEEKIKDDLNTDLDLFRPIADYKLAVSNSESPSKETRIEEFMSELMAKSWDRDDE